MIEQLIDERKLPELLSFIDGSPVTAESWQRRRLELIELMAEEYGMPPPAPVEITYSTKSRENSFCAGKATLEKVKITSRFENGSSFSFSVSAVYPKADGKYPVFIFPNFLQNVPDRYLPSEELCDLGCAVVSFYYGDVSSDDANYSDGLAALFCGENENTELGKISLWAWAASRTLDYALTLDKTDADRTAVIGHSRLGKTALWAGALDERFSAVISNDSGCSGAAISRGKCGETIEKINNVFPHWFKSSYAAYSAREYEAPFDQHFVLALAAPRKLYVASAVEDTWADPDSEYLGLCEALKAWKLLGEDMLTYPDAFPQINKPMHTQKTGCHKRSGSHYMSRYDWQQYAEFIKG